jgi:hypothetical protein
MSYFRFKEFSFNSISPKKEIQQASENSNTTVNTSFSNSFFSIVTGTD